MEYKYSAKAEEGSARALGLALPISFKQSVEVCDFIRGKELTKAIAALGRVVKEEMPVPYRRFNKGTGHKAGMAAGRFPKKTCTYIVRLLKDAQANAEHKGLTENLIIKHISAQKGAKSFHYGRKRRRMMKKTHIELIVGEAKND